MAKIIERYGFMDATRALEEGKGAAFKKTTSLKSAPGTLGNDMRV